MMRTGSVIWGLSSLLHDTSILHHVFISIFIALWAVITQYISVLMAILSFFTRFTMKRGNAGSWNSWLEKEQILETYSAQLQKSWNFKEVISRIYKKYWAKKVPEGAHEVGARPGGRARPHPRGKGVAPWWISSTEYFLYILKTSSVKFQDFWSCAE